MFLSSIIAVLKFYILGNISQVLVFFTPFRIFGDLYPGKTALLRRFYMRGASCITYRELVTDRGLWINIRLKGIKCLSHELWWILVGIIY